MSTNRRLTSDRDVNRGVVLQSSLIYYAAGVVSTWTLQIFLQEKFHCRLVIPNYSMIKGAVRRLKIPVESIHEFKSLFLSGIGTWRAFYRDL